MGASVGPAEGVISVDDHDVVFISYRRSDGPLVARLVEQLERSDVRVWIDVSDIRPAAEWMSEIRAGITNARAFVALLSPSYFESDICVEEISHARDSGKAIIPVVIDSIDIPEELRWLRGLQWIQWRPDDDPADACRLIELAATSDIAWSDLHADLLRRANDWVKRGRPSSALLRGRQLEEAEAELSRERRPEQPKPSASQREFVEASRRHRRRTGRRTLVAVSGVALVAVALAGLALWQRNRATDAADEARLALAAADFERLSTAADAAPDLITRARYAARAAAAGGAAGVDEPQWVQPLIEALGSDADFPLALFEVRSENQLYTGDHRGAAVSGDGSTLAHITLLGELRIIDLWTHDLRASIDVSSLNHRDLSQIALDFDGERLLYAQSESRFAEGGQAGLARVVVYDLSHEDPTVAWEDEVFLGDQLAAVSFGPDDNTYVFVRVTGEVVIAKHSPDGVALSLLGDPGARSNAGLMLVSFSLDQNRVCVTGDAAGLYQVDPPMRLAIAPQATCVPEPCSGDPRSHVRIDEQGSAICVDSGGFTLAQLGRDCEQCSRTSEHVVVPGPRGDQRVELPIIGSISLFGSSAGLLVPSEIQALPPTSVGVWSGPGRPVIAELDTGELYFEEAPSVEFPHPDPQLWGDFPDLVTHIDSTGAVATVVDGALVRYVPGADEPTTLVDAVVAVAFHGDHAVVALPEAIEIWDVTSGARLDADGGVSACVVNWSVSGHAIAAVGCSDDGAAGGSVRSWVVGDAGVLARVAEHQLPMVDASHVTVSDDGSTLALSRGNGETALWNGTQWVAEPTLSAEAPPTNDYKSGWSMLDSSGSWLLVRKNLAGISLWAIGEDDLTYIAKLSHTSPFNPPTVVAFEPDELRLAWGGPDPVATEGRQIFTWLLDPASLALDVCGLSSSTALPATVATEALDRYRSICTDVEEERDDPPIISRPTPSIAEPLSETGELTLTGFQSLALPVGANPRVIVRSDFVGPFVMLAGAQVIDVDVETSEVRQHLRLEEGTPPINRAVASDFEYYFARSCGDVFQWSRLDGRLAAVVPQDGRALTSCGGLALAGGRIWTATSDAFVGVNDQGVTVEVAHPRSYRGRSPMGLLANLDGQLVALLGEGGGGPPALLRLDTELLKTQVDDLPRTAAALLQVDEDGTAWLSGDSGLVSVSPDGAVNSLGMPEVDEVTSIARDSLGRRWFTTLTEIGVIGTDGTVRHVSVSGAQSLGSMTFLPNQSLIVALDSATGVFHRFSIAGA